MNTSDQTVMITSTLICLPWQKQVTFNSLKRLDFSVLSSILNSSILNENRFGVQAFGFNHLRNLNSLTILWINSHLMMSIQ